MITKPNLEKPKPKRIKARKFLYKMQRSHGLTPNIPLKLAEIPKSEDGWSKMGAFAIAFRSETIE
jgi:hypothetical protein